MPRSFLVKKSLKGEEAGYHSYRVRDPYDEDVLDVSLKAVTPYTPYSPPALPAAVAPLTVRVNNGKSVHSCCRFHRRNLFFTVRIEWLR